MSIVKKFAPIRHLNSLFVKTFRLISVLGGYTKDDENFVFIVAKDDKVYVMGDNEYGCLGLGNDIIAAEKLTIVEDLCDKGIHFIANGFNHMIALSKDGSVYAWGNNEFGQLGDGSTEPSGTPTLVEALRGKCVTEISCGHFHTLALTQSGEVYAWGYNRFGQIGNGTEDNQLTPVKVIGFGAQTPAVSVSCGQFHSLAITSGKGHLYSWGNNIFGQLGVRDTVNQSRPVRVSIESDVIIRWISCGSNHSLFLTEDGDVYAFGGNMFGQIGIGSTMHKKSPQRIKVASVKFVDIAATFDTDISVALSGKGVCYIWGNNTEEHITVPRETDLKSIHEVFAEYFEPQFTYKPIML